MGRYALIALLFCSSSCDICAIYTTSPLWQYLWEFHAILNSHGLSIKEIVRGIVLIFHIFKNKKIVSIIFNKVDLNYFLIEQWLLHKGYDVISSSRKIDLFHQVLYTKRSLRRINWVNHNLTCAGCQDPANELCALSIGGKRRKQ